MKKIFRTWYLDLCFLQYFCNNKKLFKNLQSMYIDFIIVTSQVI